MPDGNLEVYHSIESESSNYRSSSSAVLVRDAEPQWGFLMTFCAANMSFVQGRVLRDQAAVEGGGGEKGRMTKLERKAGG